ncbi:MAG: hypothetical protein GY820_29590 [Gammaproteobacteria bacterium]|nr:hypothetical protein [Gammaproteobacteria bacterium]
MTVAVPATANQASIDIYEFNQVDREAEKQRNLEKFELDRKKIDLAIDNTKVIIRNSPGKPFLPELYMRLAELHIEKSRILYFSRRVALSKDETLSAVDELEVNNSKIKAVEIYQRILTHFPNYENADQAMFFMAHEFREIKRHKDMVEQYKTLIKSFPKSRYQSESNLLLGDYFFGKNNVNFALHYYSEALKHENLSAKAIAKFKLAWVYINQREFKKALKFFEESVQDSKNVDTSKVDTYKRVDIRQQSLNDAAFSYTEVNKNATPQEAVKYFKALSWSRTSLIEVLEKLASRYKVKKKWDHSGYIYHVLQNIQTNPLKILEYAESVYEGASRGKVGKNSPTDVKSIVNALRRLKNSVHTDQEALEDSLVRFEIMSRDMATKLHDLARNKKQKALYISAAEAYNYYLNFFKDSAVYTDIHVNYAEALFAAEEFLLAGQQYEKLARNNDQLDESSRNTYLYRSVLSYYSDLSTNKSRERKNIKHKLNYYNTAYARAGLVDSGSQYIAQYPNSENNANVSFNIAWIKYDEAKYYEAIKSFSKFVEEYPSAKEVNAAVDLVVDSYQLLEDYEGLVAFGNKMLATRSLSGEARANLTETVSVAESKLITGLTVASNQDWDAGKEELLKFAEDNSDSNLGEQALYALFVASEGKGDLESLYSSGLNLIKKYPQSKNGDKIHRVLIDASLKSSQFRILANTLEKFATQYPTNKDSADFMMRAALLREGLRQPDQALRNYQTLLKMKGSKQEFKRSAVDFRVNYLLKGQDWKKAASLLSQNIKLYQGEEKLRNMALLARLYALSGQASRAKQQYASAIKVFKATGGDSVQAAGYLAEALYIDYSSLLDSFLATKFAATLDNAIFEKKTKQLEVLQKNYEEVLGLKSPEWTILACYRIYEINSEYANFLKTAPVPELSDEERQQYVQLIAEQASTYDSEGQEFLKTGQQLASKIKSFNPQVRKYILAEGERGGERISKLSGGFSNKVINVESLSTPKLRELHYKLFKNKGDTQASRELVQNYIELGDLFQADVIAKNLLSESSPDESTQSYLYTVIGYTYLATGQDSQARDTFVAALEKQSGNSAARINLAGLYEFHGLVNEAEAMKVNAAAISNAPLVHPDALGVLTGG